MISRSFSLSEMPNRKAHKEAFSAAAFDGRRSHKDEEFEAKKHGGRSMKNIVRSLSDRYAAVTSPLTCKRKTSCSNRTPSLKTMKTTTATNLLPLKPALSVSCRPVMQSTPIKESHSSSVSSTRTHNAPLVGIPNRLLHMQTLSCTETPVYVPRTHVVRRFQSKGEPKGLALRAPSATTPLHLKHTPGVDRKFSSPGNQIPEIGVHKALLLESSASRHRHTRHALEALSRDYKNQTQEWEQFQVLLKQKDNELDSLQTAGLMLKELCVKQDDEIKTLKAAFPATLREVGELREVCQKQEKELAHSRVAIPALQAQVATLTEQLRCLAEDFSQMKALNDESHEKVSFHFHEREASNCSSSCLSMEPSPATNGFLESLRQNRRAQSVATSCEDRLTPVRVCEVANSCCSSVTSIGQSSDSIVYTKHRRGYSAVLSVEHLLKGTGKRSGRRFPEDKDIVDPLQQPDNASEKNQALLQERCGSAPKDLRSSSSRLASLEPIKSIFTCGSPQLQEFPLNKKQVIQLPKGSMWNLKPT